jgi:plasmid stabilization system protein ParE
MALAPREVAPALGHVTKFAVADEAEAELIGAGDWYHANARPGVAQRFREAIERAFSELGEAPDEFPVIEEWHGVLLRRVLLRGFPYQIVYGHLEGVLWVFAVAHLHRRPGYWRERLPAR